MEKLTKRGHENHQHLNQQNTKSNDLIKEVHETSSLNSTVAKPKKHVTIHDPGSSPPAMYKIALRLKKLTESHVKKSSSESNPASSKESSQREGSLKLTNHKVNNASSYEFDDNQKKSLISPTTVTEDFETEIDSSNCIGELNQKKRKN